MLTIYNTILPGLCGCVHCVVSCDGPTQALPPCEGGGFVHERVRVLVPLPQRTSHVLQGLQCVHTPLTAVNDQHGNENTKVKFKMNSLNYADVAISRCQLYVLNTSLCTQII